MRKHRLVSVTTDDLDVQYHVLHGHRRALRQAGRGPALLFIHGIGDSSATWLDVLPALTADFTVIAPDLLGHGHSDRPRADYSVPAYANGMRDLLTVLDVDSVTVVGHSLGGGVAAQFAYQFPAMVERLVLVSAGGMGRGVHPMLRFAAAPGADLVAPLTTSAPVRMFVDRVRGPLRILGLRHDLDYVLGLYSQLADRQRREAFLRTLRAVVDWRGQAVTMLDRAYLTANVPVMLVWGTHDVIVPSGHAAKAHAAMPHCRLETFAGSGHFPHHDDPLRFVAALRDFIAGTLPTRYDAYRWRTLLREGDTTAHAQDEDAVSSGS